MFSKQTEDYGDQWEAALTPTALAVKRCAAVEAAARGSRLFYFSFPRCLAEVALQRPSTSSHNRIILQFCISKEKILGESDFFSLPEFIFSNGKHLGKPLERLRSSYEKYFAKLRIFFTSQTYIQKCAFLGGKPGFCSKSTRLNFFAWQLGVREKFSMSGVCHKNIFASYPVNRVTH